MMMNDGRLIQLVKSYIELYDQAHKKYANLVRKEHIWRKIGAELKQQPIACKTRWNNIRDIYRKLMRRRSANPVANYKRYKYESQLVFLAPFFREKGNCDVVSEDTYSYNQPEEEDDLIRCDLTTFIDTNTSVQSDESEDNNDLPVGPQLPTKQCRRTVTVNRRHGISETTPVKLMKLLIEEKTNEQLACRLQPVDAFLASLAPTLKALSPIRLNLTKSKIFALVQEQEMDMFLEHQNKTMRKISTYETHEASNQNRCIVSDALSSSTSAYSRTASPLPMYVDIQPPLDGYTIKSEIREILHPNRKKR